MDIGRGKGFVLNHQIEIIEETASTNADILNRLQNGESLSGGHWLVANRQISGRGRLGRVWEMDEGNFAGSTAVHLLPNDPASTTLAFVTGIALHKAVTTIIGHHDNLRLKWPNDLLLGGAKLAGILLERCGNSVVIGVGVNLIYAPILPDRLTTSLSAYDIAKDRDGFSHILAGEMASALHVWRYSGLPVVLEQYRGLAHPIGTRLSVLASGDMIAGEYAGLAGDGALLLKQSDGSVRTIYSGDVEQET